MGLTGLPEMSSTNHDPWYHEVHHLSNTIIVLVFSELASFVRKILQREENKGVELTVHRGNGLREGSSESKRRKKNKTKNKEKETSATTLALLQESGNRKNKLRQNPKGCPARMDNSESFRNLPFGAIGLGAPSRRIANLTNATPPSGKLAIRVDLFKR